MTLADLSIKRPIFITCLVLVMIAVGILSMRGLGIDLNPNVNFPFITVVTTYPGVGPTEIETLIAKPLEDEIGTISGVKRLSSNNTEGLSVVIVEFTLKTDAKYAEQQVRDKVNVVKRNFPTEVTEPVVQRFDINEQPTLMLALRGDLRETELYELADETIRRRLEQVDQVGHIDIYGGRKREIHVELDRSKLKARDLSVSAVAGQIAQAGDNIPSGKVSRGDKETVFRTLGEFRSLADIQDTVVKMFGNEVPVRVGDIGKITDSMADETSRSYVNGTRAIFINVVRQTGANTVAVAEDLKKTIGKLNEEFKTLPGKPEIVTTLDLSQWIKDSVADVKESILLGIILTIITVFFFLGNGRSTIITGLALPNSLLGAFILMAIAGFTINTVTLIALSLTVGLLIDDAIVVRENIYRHIEAGENPITAAKKGTSEVSLAVIATTLVVIAVFGPIAFMQGMIGQFFREFGLTICFAMVISLFDALTMAPMLSAYFAVQSRAARRKNIVSRIIEKPVASFARFQTWLERLYEKLLGFTLRRPLLVLGFSLLVFVTSLASFTVLQKTFMPEEDNGHFGVSMELPPGTSMDATEKAARRLDDAVRSNPDVEISALTIGGGSGKSHRATITLSMLPPGKRKLTTMQLKERIREQVKKFPELNPKVVDWASTDGNNQQPFNLNVLGDNQEQLEKVAQQVVAILKRQKGLTDIDTSYRAGKPEFQMIVPPSLAESFGISSKNYGLELRAQVEGLTPAKFRQNGKEYDIRVRLLEDQRDLKENFSQVYVPNINGSLIQLAKFAKTRETLGPASINRQDRSRVISITAALAPGAGLGNIMEDVRKELAKEVKLPPGMRFDFVGDAEFYEELMVSMAIAIGFSILFIFMVLSSLYESFVTPLTIMLALPLAVCGAFIALFVSGQPASLYSMIGIILLLGVACKNSILLVDCARQLMAEGLDRKTAMIQAGTRRLRPILMTTMALIAGTIPVALGLNEASKPRTGMGIAIIGGLISSTLLTLLVIPAAFAYVDRFRIWSAQLVSRWVKPTADSSAAIVGFILTGLAALHAPNAEADSLNLSTYLEQVQKRNDALASTELAQSAADARKVEGELLTQTSLFTELQTTVDRKPRLTPEFTGTGADATSFSLGVQKQMPFGLQTRLYYNFSYASVIGLPAGLVPNSSYYTGATVLELRQPLWRNGFGRQIRADQTQARAGQLASLHNNAYAARVLLSNAEAAYWRLYFSRQLVRISGDALDRTAKIRDWNAKRVQRDLADPGDLLQAEAGFQSQQLEVKRAQDEERVSARQVNAFRTIDSDQVPESLTDNPDTIAATAQNLHRIGTRHDVLAASQQTEVARAASESSEDRLSPTLDLFANASLNSLDPGVGKAITTSLGTQYPAVGAGLSFSVPLDRSTNRSLSRAYRLERESSEKNLARKRFEADQQWTELTQNVQLAEERLQYARKIEESQRAKLDYERKQLYLGKSNTYRVLQFELDYDQAQLARVREQATLLTLLANARIFDGAEPEQTP